MNTIKKDNFIFGFILGILFPALFFGFIWVINYILLEINVVKYPFDLESHILLSFISNMLLIRYYFLNLKYENTGKGVLMITFVSIILFFVLKDNILSY